jgi:DNA replication protein DnaC
MTGKHPVLLQASATLQGIIKDRQGWVLFHSACGRGKSYLLAASVNEATRQGLSGIYYQQASEMLQELQDAQMHEHKLSYNALVRVLVQADVLALDEFGEHKDSEFRLVALRQVLNARSDVGGWKPTIFATNRHPDELDRRYPWLFSRFQHSLVHEFSLAEVPDLRAGAKL